MKKDISITTISIYIIIFFFIQNVFCQTPINIIQSNQLDQIIINDTIFQKFSGNVIIEYSDLKIKCDTILIDEYKILMEGWGNTEIFNDTIHCITDSVNIFQFENKILFYQNTVLKTDSMIIYSNELEYDYDAKELSYFKGGNIQLNNQNIESQKFIHYLNTGVSRFNQNVYSRSQDYQINTNAMTHNKDTIRFHGETLIRNNDFRINCNQGFLKESVILKLSQGLVLNMENETIKSDNLKRDIKNNINHFTKNVHIETDEDTHILGENLIQIDSISTMTESCEIQLLTKEDSIYITGEIIKIDERNENVEIIDNVFIKGQDLDGNCKTMEFKSNGKRINMLTKPVLWFSDVQITGDTIMLFRENKQLDSMYIPKKPFIISPHDSLPYYNQIKGKFLEGKFKENKIEYIKVNGNGKMKYFDDNNDSMININNIEAGNIKLFFNKNKVNNVLCYDQIESNHIEVDNSKQATIKTEVFILDGFNMRNRVNE